MKVGGTIRAQHMPRAYWAYLILTGALIIDAAIPSETIVSVGVFGALTFATLLIGLTLKSQACRRVLIACSLFGALSLFMLQSTHPDWRDISLMALYLGQACLLSTGAMRLHTAKP
jgi:hypothetical protein